MSYARWSYSNWYAWWSGIFHEDGTSEESIIFMCANTVDLLSNSWATDIEFTLSEIQENKNKCMEHLRIKSHTMEESDFQEASEILDRFSNDMDRYAREKQAKRSRRLRRNRRKLSIKKIKNDIRKTRRPK